MRIKDKNNALPITNDFTQAGVYAHRKFSGNLEVYRPPETLCITACMKTPTRLVAMQRKYRVEKIILPDSVVEKSAQLGRNKIS